MAKKRKTVPHKNWDLEWAFVDAEGIVREYGDGSKLWFKQHAIDFKRGVTGEQVDGFFGKLEGVLLDTECHQFMIWFEPPEYRQEKKDLKKKSPKKEDITREEAWVTRQHVSRKVYYATKKATDKLLDKIADLNKTVAELDKELKKIPGCKGMRPLGLHWFERVPHDVVMKSLVLWEEEYQRFFDTRNPKKALETLNWIRSLESSPKEKPEGEELEEIPKVPATKVPVRRKKELGTSGRPQSLNSNLIYHGMRILLASKSKTRVKNKMQAARIVAEALTYFADEPPTKSTKKRVNPDTVYRTYNRMKKEYGSSL